MRLINPFKCLAFLAGFGAVCLAPSAHAVVVYAAGNFLSLYSLDVNVAAGTSSLIQTYSINSSSFGVPSATFSGIAVVGDTIFATASSSTDAGRGVNTKIFKFDAGTGASLGFIQTEPRQMTGLAWDGMAGLAWDGASFWTASVSGDYGYQVDLAGHTVNTISFSQSLHLGITGLEYFDGKIIANDNGAIRGADLHFPRVEPNNFSVYTPQGGLVAGKLISGSGSAVVFDGTNFLLAGVSGGAYGLYVYDGGTAAFVKFIPTPSPVGTIRDLSVDYSLRVDTTGGTVPEGGPALTLFAAAMCLCTIGRWRRNLA